jgi:hypothetical protein
MFNGPALTFIQKQEEGKYSSLVLSIRKEYKIQNVENSGTIGGVDHMISLEVHQ